MARAHWLAKLPRARGSDEGHLCIDDGELYMETPREDSDLSSRDALVVDRHTHSHSDYWAEAPEERSRCYILSLSTAMLVLGMCFVCICFQGIVPNAQLFPGTVSRLPRWTDLWSSASPQKDPRLSTLRGMGDGLPSPVPAQTDKTSKSTEMHVVKDFVGSVMHQAGPLPHFPKGDEVCNKTQPLTDHDWAPRGWDVSVGNRIQCESRNRVKAQWKDLRSANWDRNWCWVGVKEVCHENLKRPKSWSQFREMAYKKGLAPSPLVSHFDGLLNPEVCDGAGHGIPKPYYAEEEQLALEWFHRNVQVYVLNLPKFYNRWSIITGRLKELHINPIRVIGIDMTEPDALSTAVANGWVDSSFDFDRAQAEAIKPENDMGHIGGTVGCAAAHFKAQSQILKERPKLAIVLEDDSWLMDNFVTNVWRIVTQELPCDWEVLQLLGRCAYGKCVSEHVARVQPDANEPAYMCHEGVNWGFHGVLYRTEALEKIQGLWKKRVFNPETPHCLDIDVALASLSDKVNYYSVPSSQYPPLIKEMDLGSVRASINLGFKVG